MKKTLMLVILLIISFAAFAQTGTVKIYQVTPDSDTSNNRYCSIASNSNGDILIIWRNNLRGMKYYFKKKGVTDGVTAEIPNEPYPESEGWKVKWMSVRATWDNIFHVAWCNDIPYSGGIVYATFNPATQQWTNPEKIIGGWIEDVHLRVSPLNGDLLLCWDWYINGAKYVYVQFKMGGQGAWTNQMTVAPKWTTNAMSSFDEEGYLYIAWKQDSADETALEPAFSLLKKDTNGTYKYLGKVIVSGNPGWFFLPTVAAVQKKGFMAAAWEQPREFRFLPFERNGDTIVTDTKNLKLLTPSPGRWEFSSFAMPFGEEILYSYKDPSTVIKMLRYKNGAFTSDPPIELNNGMASNWLYDTQEDPNIGVLTVWSTYTEPNRIFYSIWDNPLIKVKPAVNVVASKKAERSFFRISYLYTVTWANNPYNVDKNVVLTKFNIYRRTVGSGGNWVLIESTSPTVLSYTDTKNVDASSNYEYYVTCLDDKGNESKIEAAAAAIRSITLK
jgi:hypothetical protein